MLILYRARNQQGKWNRFAVYLRCQMQIDSRNDNYDAHARAKY